MIFCIKPIAYKPIAYKFPISMMSMWSWVRALTEAKEKAKGHGITVLMSEDHQRGGALTIKGAFYCESPPFGGPHS